MSMTRIIGAVWLTGLLLLAPLSARTLSYATLHAMPKSVEKDYYLWRYFITAKCTKSDAKKLINEAKYVNGKLAKAYRKKTGKRAPRRRSSRRSKPLTAAQKKEIQRKKKVTLSLFKQANPWATWHTLPPDMQVYAFNHAGKAGRKALDHTISPKLYAQLTTQKGFNGSIRRIRHERLPKWSNALLHPPAKKHRLTHNTLLRLGFNGLYRGKPKTAEMYFRLASQKSKKREEVDQALFWAYMSRQNKRFLHKLTRSYDINIYTLLARDILHQKYPKTITPKLPSGHSSGSKISDPIHWAKLKRKIFDKKTNKKALAKQYRSEEAVGYYTYILSKASHDTEQYFPMPYRDLLAKLPKSRQAILYAIARQESRFVPASISTSYALGMMQIMPFLVRHLAKQRQEKVNYDAMFNPRKALIYANKHMNYLTKWLKHPLFIAYAYNAGIGYTRRLIRKKHLFNGKGAYEPYLSLELLDNDQARHYGKHVLTNYVIYMNKLGTPLRMIDLLRFIHRPEKTDNFRKRKH
jgi:soluble lytic murein transglycosylase